MDIDGKPSISPISERFIRAPKHRNSLPPRLVHHSQTENASPSHIASSADRFLLGHIANSKEYFTDEKTSLEWLQWVKSNMREEWDAFMKRSQTHAEDCSRIVEEMEEIERKIAYENRTQSIQLIMAVKERVQAKEMGHLLILRDELERKKRINEESWKDAISAVRNAEVVNAVTKTEIQVEVDALEEEAFGQGLVITE